MADKLGIDYSTAIKTWTPEQWQSFGVGGGSIGDNGDLISSDSGSMFGGFGDYLGKQRLGDITSTVGLGLGSFNDLFGTGAKQNKQALENAKKSGTLLSQQIESNKQSIEDRKAFNAGMADASRQAMGLGTVYNYKK